MLSLVEIFAGQNFCRACVKSCDRTPEGKQMVSTLLNFCPPISCLSSVVNIFGGFKRTPVFSPKIAPIQFFRGIKITRVLVQHSQNKSSVPIEIFSLEHGPQDDQEQTKLCSYLNADLKSKLCCFGILKLHAVLNFHRLSQCQLALNQPIRD